MKCGRDLKYVNQQLSCLTFFAIILYRSAQKYHPQTKNKVNLIILVSFEWNEDPFTHRTSELKSKNFYRDNKLLQNE